MIGAQSWYLQRLKSMSVPEMAYRSVRLFKSRLVKREVMLPEHLSAESIPGLLPEIEYSGFKVPDQLDVFGLKINPDKIEDWSLDISTGNRFPLIPSASIDVRSLALGSAKHVWEINRMLFLPWLAIRSRQGDLNSIRKIQVLISSWCLENPYGKGVNWYSNIEVNIRLINWFVTWEILQVEKMMRNDHYFSEFVKNIWLPSIYQHCRFSFEHPSRYSSANNHLLAEYAGLFIASSKWRFRESVRWNRYSKSGLETEIIKQHTENGINREEAAEYIQFVSDFLLLAMIVGDGSKNHFSERYRNRFHKILLYIKSFIDVKGNSPHYGDEDNGSLCLLNEENRTNNFISLLASGAIYFRDENLLHPLHSKPDQKNTILFGRAGHDFFSKASKELCPGSSRFFPEDGHFIFRKQDPEGHEVYAHFDAAPLGYLSIAAHGHADALSFVLHLNGQPFLTDPGAYCYHKGSEWRKYFVSTAAHNTVTINESNQAFYIGPTLWASHYKVRVLDSGMQDQYEYLTAEHDGYKNFKITHTRKFEFFRQENRFLITDTIHNSSGNPARINLAFHFHPDLMLMMKTEGCQLTHNNSRLLIRLDPAAEWKVVCGERNPLRGWYSSSFYKKSVTPVLTGSVTSSATISIRTELLINF